MVRYNWDTIIPLIYPPYAVTSYNLRVYEPETNAQFYRTCYFYDQNSISSVLPALTCCSQAAFTKPVRSKNYGQPFEEFLWVAKTPENRGLNDTWSIPALRAYSEFSVSVYNRYGQLIFYTKNNFRLWDGKYKGLPQPADVYVYMVAIKGEKLLKGTLMLVR